jgi:hypothetical protein
MRGERGPVRNAIYLVLIINEPRIKVVMFLHPGLSIAVMASLV